MNRMRAAFAAALLLASAAAAHPGADDAPRPVRHDEHVLIVTNPDGPALVMDAGSCLIGPAHIGSNQGRPTLEIAAGASYPPGCGQPR